MAALEKAGYEAEGKRVLTESDLGVPVTIMTLLVKDALAGINEHQERLLAQRKPNLKIIRTLDVEKEYGNVFIDTDGIKDYEWEVGWTVTSATPTISGSTQFFQAVSLSPRTSLPAGLNSYLNDAKENISFYDDVVLITKKESPVFSTMEFLKDVLQFCEFTYAVQRRIRGKEKESFERLIGATITIPTEGSSYNRILQMRGNLIHQGAAKLRLNPVQSTFTLEGRRVDELGEESFDQMLDWVDTVYGRMLNELASSG